MNIEKWIHGCRVSVDEWLNGDLRIGVEYFRPGTSLSQPPVWERVLIAKATDRATVGSYLDSIVYNIITRPEWIERGVVREKRYEK